MAAGRGRALTRARRPDLWTLYEKEKARLYGPAFSRTAAARRLQMNLLQTLEAEQMKAVRAKAASRISAPATR